MIHTEVAYMPFTPYANCVLKKHLEDFKLKISNINDAYPNKSAETKQLIEMMNHTLDALVAGILLFDNGKSPGVLDVKNVWATSQAVTKFNHFMNNYSITDEAGHAVIAEIVYLLYQAPKNVPELLPFLKPSALEMSIPGVFSLELKKGSHPDDYKYHLKSNKDITFKLSDQIQENINEMIDILLFKAQKYYIDGGDHVKKEKIKTRNYIEFVARETEELKRKLNPYQVMLHKSIDMSQSHVKDINDDITEIEKLLVNKFGEVVKRAEQYENKTMRTLLGPSQELKEGIDLDSLLPGVLVGNPNENEMITALIIGIKARLVEENRLFFERLNKMKGELVSKKQELIHAKEASQLEELIDQHKLKVQSFNISIENIWKLFEGVHIGIVKLMQKGSESSSDLTTEIQNIDAKLQQLDRSLVEMRQHSLNLEAESQKAKKESEVHEVVAPLYQEPIADLSKKIELAKQGMRRIEADKSKLEETKRKKEMEAASKASSLEDVRRVLDTTKISLAESKEKVIESLSLIESAESEKGKVEDELRNLASQIEQKGKDLANIQTRNVENDKVIEAIFSVLRETIPVRGTRLNNFDAEISFWEQKECEFMLPMGLFSPNDYVDIIKSLLELIEANKKEIPFNKMDEIYFKEFQSRDNLRLPFPRDGYLKLLKELNITATKNEQDWVSYRNRKESIFSRATATEFSKRKKPLIAELESKLNVVNKIIKAAEMIRKNLQTVKDIQHNSNLNKESTRDISEQMTKAKDAENRTREKLAAAQTELELCHKRHDSNKREQSELEFSHEILTGQVALLEKENRLNINDVLSDSARQADGLLPPKFNEQLCLTISQTVAVLKQQLASIQAECSGLKRKKPEKNYPGVVAIEKRIELHTSSATNVETKLNLLRTIAEFDKEVINIEQESLKTKSKLVNKEIIDRINSLYKRLDAAVKKQAELLEGTDKISGNQEYKVKLDAYSNRLKLTRETLLESAKEQLNAIQEEMKIQNEIKSEKFKSNEYSDSTKHEHELFVTESMLEWSRARSNVLENLLVTKDLEKIQTSIKQELIDFTKDIEEKEKVIKRHQSKIEERRCLVRVFQEENKSYLLARAERFWLRDALHLSDRKKREFYVAELNKALNDYIDTGDKKVVLNMVDEGIRKFGGKIYVPMILTPLKQAIVDFENEPLSSFSDQSENAGTDNKAETQLTTVEKARLVKIFDIQYKQYCNNKKIVQKDRLFSPINGNDNKLAEEIKRALHDGNKDEIHKKIEEGKGKFGNLVLVPILLHPLEKAMKDLVKDKSLDYKIRDRL